MDLTHHRPSTPTTADKVVDVASTLTSNLSFHALWSIDISRQGLTHITTTLPDGSPAPSPFPPVMGYLNVSNNRLGITAIANGLAGVKAIFHLNIVGNPATRGFGIQPKVALPHKNRDVPMKPVAPSSGCPSLSEADARDVLIASMPFVWCLNFAFIDPETDKRASSTIDRRHLNHLLQREPRFTAVRWHGTNSKELPKVANPWGKQLVNSIPKAVDYDWRSCFWQLQTLAKDIDGEIREDGQKVKSIDSLGKWVEFPIDNTAAGLMFCTSLLLILDPWVSKELARACLPNVWGALNEMCPGRELPSWSVLLATSSVQVFKVIAVVLGIIKNDAAKASRDEQLLHSCLEEQVQILSEEQFDDMRKMSKCGKSTPRNQRIAVEVLSLIASLVPECDFILHAPWLFEQVAALSPASGVQDSRLVGQHGTTCGNGVFRLQRQYASGQSIVQQRYSLLSTLERLLDPLSDSLSRTT